jgi:Acyltransferase family
MNNPAEISLTQEGITQIRAPAIKTGRSPERSVKQKHFYLPELDSLRFFAFLVVFADHVCLLSGLSSLAIVVHVGAHGVDLFFALSAYLLTELMLREKDLDCLERLDVSAFYVRRVLRIWTLYYGFLLVTFCATLAYPIAGIPPGSLAIYSILLGDLPIASPTSLIIVSLWSISLEEQFYLVWPNVMQRLSRRGAAAAGALLWLCCVVLRLYILVSGRGLFWLRLFRQPESTAALHEFCLHRRGLRSVPSQLSGSELDEERRNRIPWPNLVRALRLPRNRAGGRKLAAGPPRSMGQIARRSARVFCCDSGGLRGFVSLVRNPVPQT